MTAEGGECILCYENDFQFHRASEIIHWSGRKERNKDVPRHVDMILVVHDYVNHALMDSVKGQAKRRRLPIIFAKRGVTDLQKALRNGKDIME
ncbi:MAG: DUF2325 domain-containing protein [Dethiobacter sp.]|nr:DUF2325 domain-containing protein [Dethiobacter sp.]